MIDAGQHRAKVVSWWVDIVEALNGEPKACILFETEDGDQIRWDGFFNKKDGGANKNTVSVLKCCGLKGDLSEILDSENGLQRGKEVFITIERDGDYLRVKWVNETSGRASSLSDGEKAKVAKLLKSLSAKEGLKPSVKNHAPGASIDDEDLPF